MTELVPIIGVSATLIAAACQEYQVPTPPRGYWSKVRAGKPIKKTPLPMLPPGISNCIRIGRPRIDTPPSPPVFKISIDELRVQVFAAVTISTHVLKTQRNPAKRIWHGLSNALADFGGVVIPKVDEPTSAIIQIYHQRVFVGLQVSGGSENEQRSGSTLSSLMLTMSKQDCTKEPVRIWQDTQEAALETKIQEIITEIVVLAEVKERDAQIARYGWQADRRNQDQTNQLERETQRLKDAETQSAARLVWSDTSLPDTRQIAHLRKVRSIAAHRHWGFQALGGCPSWTSLPRNAWVHLRS